MKKLVLFDVDHTLVDVGNAHKSTFVSAFNQLCNIDMDLKNWKFHGYTDLQIIHDILDLNNKEKDPILIEKIMKFMINEFKTKNLNQSILMDGVGEILTELNRMENVIIGLVTGNLEEIAYGKLKHLNIDEYFILGGFGNISTNRSDLIEVAVKQAEKDFGKIKKNNIFIVGDTIRDIEAARNAGVKVIAVSTGTFSSEELKKHNPDYLAKNLMDKKIVEMIESD